jgi:arylsulfatase A-like enzyme
MLRWILTISALVGASTTDAATRRPNVVVVLADDLGYTDLSSYGSKYYESPNVDRLASDGVRFTNGYTCGANCQPTRAALMSGQYGPRTGIYTVGKVDRFPWQTQAWKPVDNAVSLPLEKVTIAETLRKAGYRTGMFGKWHLGNTPEHHPSKQGFEEAIASAGKHFDFKTTPKVDVPEGEYLADFLTDKAVDFIERHKDEPFFLYVPHYAVHSPHQGKEELIARFKDKKPVGGHHDPVYAAMIASVDESVGRIVAKLDELGLSDDTIVIFTSDNGGVGGYNAEGVGRNEVTSNAPLRGGKATYHEGGIRVPYVFKYPGKIAAGRVSDEPINSVDLYPSLLELTGAAAPQDYPLDGRSYLPLLLDENAQLAKRDLFWHFPGYLGGTRGSWASTPQGVIRSGDYKLVEHFDTGAVELYDLTRDLGETTNLATSKPEVVEDLKQRLAVWRGDVGAKLPTPNDPDPDFKAQKRGTGKKQRRRAQETI